MAVKIRGRERVLKGKMAVIWQFKNKLSKTIILEQVGYNFS
jgi:hypothetical protein